MKKLTLLITLLFAAIALGQESFVQVPPDSTGKKLRHFQQTIGANTIYLPGFFLSSTAGTELGLVGSPIFVEFSDGAASYVGAKTGQFPAALVGGRLDVNVGNIPAVSQSGTWTMQPGNTANTTAWLVTGTGGTFPVTGTFWQATQPVSGTVTSNQGTAAAIAAAWPFRLTDLTNYMPTMDAAARRGYVQVTDGTNSATVTAGGSLNINCTGGCTAGGSFADSTAFSFGSTAVGNMSAVVDDVATNTVAENSAGAVRMNGNRILYVDLSKTAANATAVKVDGSAATQPVSGTFWQTTQPVSGTFWQATQPVSGTVTANVGATNGLTLDASVTALQVAQGSTTAGEKGGLALGAVTTAAPTYTTAQSSPLSLSTTGALRVDGSAVTQPVSGTVALGAGAAVIGHVIADTGSTTAVTGNVTAVQATGTNLHAVIDSGSTTAVTQATGTNLHAVIDTGSTTAVTQGTAANLNATVVQGTGSNLHVAVDSAPSTAVTNAGLTDLDATTQTVTNGTAGTKSQLVGGVFNTAPPTLTNGQGSALQSNAKGELIVAQPTAADLNATVTGIVALSAGSAVIGHVINDAGAAVIGHVIADTGSTTAVTGNVTAVQATGTNLHAVLDTTSTTAVTQATGTNLHAVIDTGSTTAATQATAANLNATVVQGAAGTAAGGWFVKQTDGTNSGTIKAASTAAVATDTAVVIAQSPNGGNPCDNPAATLVGIAGATSGTAAVQLVALSGTTKIYLCSVNITGISGTTPTFSLKYGTGTACATGGVTILGAWTTAPNVIYTFYQPFVTPAGQELCYLNTGTTPIQNYAITYVQQ